MPMKILKGTVISNKMDKTVVIAVERVFQHPFYKKQLKQEKITKHMTKKTGVRLGMWLK